jgi:DNA-binding GntR family transcriptional regulator
VNKNNAAPSTIYAQLKEMILSFKLYPGSRVTETELANHFQVSRTPVREALKRLENEGALTIRPKQGCFIRAIDLAELTDYYRVRIALELLSVELAAATMPDRELTKLAKQWDPEQQRGRTKDAERMASLDEGFHLALAQGGGNQALVALLKDVNNRIHVIRRLDFTDEQRIERTYQEHFRIVQHLLQRDITAAKRELVKHIRRSEEFTRSLTLMQLATRRPAAGGKSL